MIFILFSITVQAEWRGTWQRRWGGINSTPTSTSCPRLFRWRRVPAKKWTKLASFVCPQLTLEWTKVSQRFEFKGEKWKSFRLHEQTQNVFKKKKKSSSFFFSFHVLFMLLFISLFITYFLGFSTICCYLAVSRWLLRKNCQKLFTRCWVYSFFFLFYNKTFQVTAYFPETSKQLNLPVVPALILCMQFADSSFLML